MRQDRQQELQERPLGHDDLVTDGSHVTGRSGRHAPTKSDSAVALVTDDKVVSQTWEK